MKRRSLLAVLGTASAAGLAGCASVLASQPETRRRVVSIDSVDEIADEHEVNIDVDLLNGEITDERTARLRVTTTNEGAQRAISAGEEKCAILNRTDERSDPEGLWLYQSTDEEWLERDGKKWTHDGDDDGSLAYALYGCGAPTYESGESVSTEYVLWDDYTVDGYLPTGTYRWEVPIRTWDGPSGFGENEPSGRFTWGFWLTVDVPETTATAEETAATTKTDAT